VIREKIAAEQLKVIEKLQKENEELKRLVKDLSERIARLEKNSTNSSKPPSSDITQVPEKETAANGGKRKQGAQKGHKKHERPPFSPEQADKIVVHELPRCPHCGGWLKAVKENAENRQQTELVTKPYKITEHQYTRYRCEACQAYHAAQTAEADKTLFRPKLMAVTACLKGRGHIGLYPDRYTALSDLP
jgi:transposase